MIEAKLLAIDCRFNNIFRECSFLENNSTLFSRIVCEEEQDYFYPTVDKNLEKMILVNTACTPIIVKVKTYTNINLKFKVQGYNPINKHRN